MWVHIENHVFSVSVYLWAWAGRCACVNMHAYAVMRRQRSSLGPSPRSHLPCFLRWLSLSLSDPGLHNARLAGQQSQESNCLSLNMRIINKCWHTHFSSGMWQTELMSSIHLCNVYCQCIFFHKWRPELDLYSHIITCVSEARSSNNSVEMCKFYMMYQMRR